MFYSLERHSNAGIFSCSVLFYSVKFCCVGHVDTSHFQTRGTELMNMWRGHANYYSCVNYKKKHHRWHDVLGREGTDEARGREGAGLARGAGHRGDADAKAKGGCVACYAYRGKKQGGSHPSQGRREFCNSLIVFLPSRLKDAVEGNLIDCGTANRKQMVAILVKSRIGLDT